MRQPDLGEGRHVNYMGDLIPPWSTNVQRPELLHKLSHYNNSNNIHPLDVWHASGVPVVAMEGDALPGRMAFSLYKTMGLEGPAEQGCCVAKDRDR